MYTKTMENLDKLIKNLNLDKQYINYTQKDIEYLVCKYNEDCHMNDCNFSDFYRIISILRSYVDKNYLKK